MMLYNLMRYDARVLYAIINKPPRFVVKYNDINNQRRSMCARIDAEIEIYIFFLLSKR